jgi:hypothetical protein
MKGILNYPVSIASEDQPGPEHDNVLSAPVQQQVAAACREVIFDDWLDTGANRPSTQSVLVRRSRELIGRVLLPSLTC